MKHRYQGKKLNRDSAHRRALLKNLVRSLVISEKIVTTPVKAKLVQRHFDRLMTSAKKETVPARRVLHRWLQDRKLVAKMEQMGKQNLEDRTSGYTRRVPLTTRRGDGALKVRVELVVMSEALDQKKKKKDILKAQAKDPATKKTSTGQKEVKKPMRKNLFRKGRP